jgi:hypothetical protein
MRHKYFRDCSPISGRYIFLSFLLSIDRPSWSVARNNLFYQSFRNANNDRLCAMSIDEAVAKGMKIEDIVLHILKQYRYY